MCTENMPPVAYTSRDRSRQPGRDRKIEKIGRDRHPSSVFTLLPLGLALAKFEKSAPAHRSRAAPKWRSRPLTCYFQDFGILASKFFWRF